jgi:uncharacterized membrane protein YfcA
MIFPVSGVETYVWLPPLVAFVVSFFTSMAGVSGAFVLLPFQMSVLGIREPGGEPHQPGLQHRVHSQRGVALCARGTHGVAAHLGGGAGHLARGGDRRIHQAPLAARRGALQGVCGLRAALYRPALVMDVFKARRAAKAAKAPETKAANASGEFRVKIMEFTLTKLTYRFQDKDYSCGTVSIFIMSSIVGIVGGVYGIGGGAIIAPFFVAIYGLPVHTVAGAALMGTFITSVAGVAFYQIIAPFYGSMVVAPDWLLGALFGVGGLCGMYLGARCQRFVPAIYIKAMLSIILLWVAGRYILNYIFS